MRLNKDLRELVELLNSNHVEFLIVGGFAVAWHGYPRFTADLDFLVRPGAPNAERIVATLDAFGFGTLGVRSADLMKPDQILQLGAKPNRIGIVTSIAGVTFDLAWENRVAGDIDGIPVSYLGREELIRNKECVAHPQDVVDVAALRRRERR